MYVAGAGMHCGVQSKLSAESRALYEYLPSTIKSQLLADRDAHGNVQVIHRMSQQTLSASISENERASSITHTRGATL